MPGDNNGKKSDPTKRALNRRNMLLGGTTLAAASAIATGSAVRIAQAQPQPAAPASGKELNTVLRDGCRIIPACSNVSAYQHGRFYGLSHAQHRPHRARRSIIFTDYYAEQSLHRPGDPLSSQARRRRAPGLLA